MEEREYAQTVIELALGRAAIMVIDARLQQESGSGFLASAVVDAYQYAQAQLAAYGGYLSGAQREAVNTALSSLAQAIRALGIEL